MRRYGWLPDIKDQRDYKYKQPLKRLFLPIPDKVDLRPFCSAVEDQGSLGSCTAQALAGNVELLDRKIDGEYSDVSRLFIYYNERLLEGTVNEDSGAFIRDGIKTLAKQGVCAESLWDYDINKFTDKPIDECYKDALDRRIVSYKRLSGVSDMLSCLADGYPIVFGIGIYESFETKEVAKTGIVPMPEADETMIGGHAVLSCGYDMAKKWFIVRNSWGESWGDKGYFYLPFEYVKKLGSDFWTIRK